MRVFKNGIGFSGNIECRITKFGVRIEDAPSIEFGVRHSISTSPEAEQHLALLVHDKVRRRMKERHARDWRPNSKPFNTLRSGEVEIGIRTWDIRQHCDEPARQGKYLRRLSQRVVFEIELFVVDEMGTIQIHRRVVKLRAKQRREMNPRFQMPENLLETNESTPCGSLVIDGEARDALWQTKLLDLEQ